MDRQSTMLVANGTRCKAIPRRSSMAHIDGRSGVDRGNPGMDGVEHNHAE